MDEEEYTEYLDVVFGMNEFDEQDLIYVQVRDADGNCVPGCFHTKPAPVEH